MTTLRLSTKVTTLQYLKCLDPKIYYLEVFFFFWQYLRGGSWVKLEGKLSCSGEASPAPPSLDETLDCGKLGLSVYSCGSHTHYNMGLISLSLLLC